MVITYIYIYIMTIPVGRVAIYIPMSCPISSSSRPYIPYKYIHHIDHIDHIFHTFHIFHIYILHPMICSHLTNHAGWGKINPISWWMSQKLLSPTSTKMPSQGSDLVSGACGVHVVSITYKTCESYGYHMVIMFLYGYQIVIWFCVVF